MKAPLFALAVLGVGVVAYIQLRAAPVDVKSEASVQAPMVSVAAPLRRRLTDFDEFAGRFEPTATVDIRPRVSGYVTQIAFTDGQIVERDQILFVIDPRPYEAALAQAEAQLAGASAQLSFAEADARRSEELLRSANISVAAHEQRIQQRQAAAALLRSAEAAVQRARLDLTFTQVRSPIRGRVSDRRIDVGNLVSGDGLSTLLTSVVAQDQLHFVFDISEGDLLARKKAVDRSPRDPLGLRVDTRPEGNTPWSSSGTLDFLDNRLQPGSGTIRARATIPNPDGAITPGQFGRIRLPRGGPYDALLIPESAVGSDQYVKVALVVDGSGVVRQKPIELGPIQEDGLIVVRSGLDAADRVIVNALMRARPGKPVRIRQATTSTAGDS